MARSMVAEADEVVVGIDTHADVHVAVAISGTGARLGSISVPTTRAGFDELLRWGSGLGRIHLTSDWPVGRSLRTASRSGGSSRGRPRCSMSSLPSLGKVLS